MNDSDKVGFVGSRECIKELHIVDIVDVSRVDCEVADAERRKILEEMRALARLNAIVRQCRLDDKARRGDVRPLYGDAQSAVARAPASRAAQRGPPR